MTTLDPYSSSSTPGPTTTGASSSDAPAFEFPREYHFPPFFTRQVNSTTHRAQTEKWSALIQAYGRHHRLFKLSLSSPQAEDLFHNQGLRRRLSLADARELLEFMRQEGRAEWIGSSKDSDIVYLYWRTPDEWARELEDWADATGQKNAVLTLWELTEGEATVGTDIRGLDQEILQKALQVLVKRGKAQIFGHGDEQGVKFF
jgi:ESCRT-II complex subunit VPS25